MAGTRLTIQATVVGQVVVLALISTWYGLCENGDVLCRPLVGQDGKEALKKIVIHSPEKLPLQPIKILVPSVDEEAWIRTCYNHPEDAFEVLVNEPQRLSVCADPELSTSEAFMGIGIYVCQAEQDFVHQTTESTLVYRQHGKGNEGTHHEGDVQKIMSLLVPPGDEPSIFRKSLVFTLQIEDPLTSDWSSWAQAVQQWMEYNHILDMPFWRIGMPVTMNHIFGGTLSKHAKNMASPNNQTFYWVPEKIMDSMFDYDPAVYEVLLYIPSKIPMSAGTPNGSAGQGRIYGTSKLVVFPQHRPIANNDTDYFQSVSNALSPYGPFVQSSIMGMSRAPLGNVIPRWYVDLYLQRVLKETKRVVEERATKLRIEMLDAGSDVAIPIEIVNKWHSAVSLCASAMTTLESHDMPCKMCAALNSLEAAIDLLDNMEGDPAMVAPLHFPVDQTAAVFAPLLFPLLIPMIAGLIREYRRFKTHAQVIKTN